MFMGYDFDSFNIYGSIVDVMFLEIGGKLVMLWTPLPIFEAVREIFFFFMI